MSLDLPVFDTKNLKRSYYTFLAVTLVLAVATIVCDIFAKSLIGKPLLLGDRSIRWMLIAISLGASFYFGNKSKKELKLVQETENWDQKFEMYERYYKRKLIWNTFSLVLTCAFLLGSNSRIFLYLLIFQALISLVFYPGKLLLTKELKTQDIIVT